MPAHSTHSKITLELQQLEVTVLRISADVLKDA